MNDRDNLFRLSQTEINIVRHYRRLNPALQDFIDRIIVDASQLPQSETVSNIIPILRSAATLG